MGYSTAVETAGCSTVTEGERAGIWLRVSTGSQDELSQLADNQRWADAHGYHVTKVYQLHGKSAFKGQQQDGLDEVIADMRAGRIKVLIVWKASRVERRGAYNAFDLAQKVRAAGGRIEYVHDSYLNDANEMSDVNLALAATLNRRESENKADAIRNGLDIALANGAATTRPPWGITSEGTKRNKKFVPTDAGRKYVPEIFSRVIGGDSLRDVAAWLNTEQTGRKWSAQTVKELVNSSTYAGRVLNSNGMLIHQCEALVDMGIFAEANKVLSDAPRRAKGPKRTVALLAGVIECPNCGGPMYRIHPERGESGAYYRCKNSDGTMALMSVVEKIVTEFMAADTRPVTRLVLVPGNDYSAEIEDTKFAMRSLDMDADDYDERHGALRARLAELKSLPATMDRWSEVETNETYAGQWARLGAEERNDWLKSSGFRVSAGKLSLRSAMATMDAEPQGYVMARDGVQVRIWKPLPVA